MQDPVSKLVGSGSFRVDLGAALKTLSAYQLADPWDCLLEWVRCANAMGASAVKLNLASVRGGPVFRVVFDGRPIALPDAGNPLAGWIGLPRASGHFRLAIGILAALRLAPALLTLESGRPGRRRRCSFRGPRDAATKAAASFSESRTHLRLEGVTPPSGWERTLAERCRMSPAEVRVGWRSLERGAGYGMAGRDFEAGGFRGRLEVPFSPRENSLIELHSLGVLMETVELDLGWAPCMGWVNDDSLAADAAFSGAVRDAELARLRPRISGEAARLVTVLARTEKTRRDAAVTGASDDIPPDEWWDAWLKAAHFPLAYHGHLGKVSLFGRAFEAALAGLALLGRREETALEENSRVRRKMLVRAGRVTGWLWDAAGRLLSGQDLTGPLDPTRKALLETPLFVKGRWYDYMSVKKISRRRGPVPFTVRPQFDRGIVWLTGERDRKALERIFPGRLRDSWAEIQAKAEERINRPDPWGR